LALSRLSAAKRPAAQEIWIRPHLARSGRTGAARSTTQTRTGPIRFPLHQVSTFLRQTPADWPGFWKPLTKRRSTNTVGRQYFNGSFPTCEDMPKT
jgi:hypothetical protein